jgi:hypothetical protein
MRRPTNGEMEMNAQATKLQAAENDLLPKAASSY